MTNKTKPSDPTGATLKRSLGLFAIVGLGLGYMTPTVVFDTFGLVAEESNNVVPFAYLTALIVMVFTAISYGKVSAAFPSAGSAYTYARESMHPNVGFLVGWVALMDYMLLPLVNVLILKSYFEAFFPEVPPIVWVLIVTILQTAIIYITMKGTSNANMVLLIISIVVMTIFVVLVVVKLLEGAGEGTLVSPKPFFHEGVQFGSVLAAATIVCFSFIGFDAVSMYTEEAKHPSIMPKAIILTVVAGGAIFLVASYFTQLLFPDWHSFLASGDDPRQFIDDSTLPLIGEKAGGQVFAVVLTAAGAAATMASSLASHASVSRMLLVMGRNGVLPRKVFGYINPTTHTPTFNVVLTGVVCLTATFFTLDQVAEFINFGALIAFTFVNLSVIAWFAIRQKKCKSFKHIFSYIIMPALGTLMTGILWVNLSDVALYGGLIWGGIGIVYLLIITRGFKRKVASFDENAAVTGFNKVPVE